jgi:hypothetical protein
MKKSLLTIILTLLITFFTYATSSFEGILTSTIEGNKIKATLTTNAPDGTKIIISFTSTRANANKLDSIEQVKNGKLEKSITIPGDWYGYKIVAASYLMFDHSKVKQPKEVLKLYGKNGELISAKKESIKSNSKGGNNVILTSKFISYPSEKEVKNLEEFATKLNKLATDWNENIKKASYVIADEAHAVRIIISDKWYSLAKKDKELFFKNLEPVLKNFLIKEGKIKNDTLFLIAGFDENGAIVAAVSDGGVIIYKNKK